MTYGYTIGPLKQTSKQAIQTFKNSKVNIYTFEDQELVTNSRVTLSSYLEVILVVL